MAMTFTVWHWQYYQLCIIYEKTHLSNYQLHLPRIMWRVKVFKKPLYIVIWQPVQFVWKSNAVFLFNLHCWTLSWNVSWQLVNMFCCSTHSCGFMNRFSLSAEILEFSVINRGFHKSTTLAIMAILPFVYSHLFAVSFFVLIVLY